MANLGRVDKLVEILEVLLDKTSRREVDWEETSRQNSYKTSFPKQTVFISGGITSIEPTLSSIEIRNSLGQVIESARGSELETVKANSAEKLIALIELVRRQVLMVEEELEDVLKNLRG